MISFTQLLASVGGVGVILLALGAGVKFFAVRFVNIAFDKKRETYKHTLELDAEAVRADNQRRIQEFSLYAVRKHQTYPELYRHVTVACYEIANSKYSYDRWYTEWDLKNIEGMLENAKVSLGRRPAIINAWKAGLQDEVVDLINSGIDKSARERAIKAYHALCRFFAENILYFSQEVREAAWRTIEELEKWMHTVTPSTKDKGEDTTMSASLDALQEVLTRELLAGSYVK